MYLNYRYEEIGDDNFEKLVVQICKKLFGIGVQGFAPGKDGGRDAKFHGKAALFPSTACPWEGITVIQAKFTAGYNTSFSDPEFFKEGVESCTIYKELDKIKKLFERGELQNYMLFANRKLTGVAEEKIRALISTRTGIPYENIFLVGIEYLESCLEDFSDIPDKVDLKPSNFPININPSALSEFIQYLHQECDDLSNELDTKIPDDYPTKRTNYKRKNKLNNFSELTANYLETKYLSYTHVIDKFLQNPANIEIRDMYVNLIEDFQIKILAKMTQYERFDDLYNLLLDLIKNRSKFLRQKEAQSLTHIVVFYMYWNCDIGLVES
ncbi:ABC-three component system protein [Acinetobacter indicus]|uniref:ABC-three component system protein n=1 Tax=Acinetobacter indicus TaxID=756892 RepID=UPI001443DEE6|nr:ABC-three component system protein [Acinetobacter indicus]